MKLEDVKCPVCRSGNFTEGQVMTTLLGYPSFIQDGVRHKHDDNCRKQECTCENGHRFALRLRPHCPSCDWVGKATCFCDTPQTLVID